MKAWWQLYNKAFTVDDCEFIKQSALQYPEQAAKVGHGGMPVEDAMRKSKIRFVPSNDPNLRFIFSHICICALEANKAFNLELSNHPRLVFNHAQFTEYSVLYKGKYEWHNDNSWITDKKWDRKISCVIQLTDQKEYEGGKLELDLADNQNLQPDQFTSLGDMIFFPSHLRHRVTEMTSGTRHSLVLWFDGPILR